MPQPVGELVLVASPNALLRENAGAQAAKRARERLQASAVALVEPAPAEMDERAAANPSS